MPTSRTKAFLDRAADAQADIEDMVEEYGEEYGNRILTLMLDPTQRDVPLWEFYGFPVELSLIDYYLGEDGSADVHNRGPHWVAEVSTMVGAARAQAWWEVFGVEFLEMSERSGAAIKRLTDRMSRAELVDAAKIGVGREAIDGSKERKRNGER